VWLTNQEGQVVLRTSIDSYQGNSGAKSPRDPNRGDEEDRASERRGVIVTQDVANTNEWDYVFGAISKEAMTSMGWTKNADSPSRR
jgi:hypothetical protein